MGGEVWRVMARSSPARPWVSANFAITWDGRISTRERTPADFSSPYDKQRLLEIRAAADAVLVSATTAKADGMTMGLPDEALRAARVSRGQCEYPLRVLLSNSGKIDPDLPVFGKQFSPIVIFSTEQMPASTRDALQSLAKLHLHQGKQVDLPAMLQTLRREHRVRRLHCEGGGMVLRSLLEANLVDEVYLTLCPKVFGSRTASTVTGQPGEFLPQSSRWKLRQMQTIGDECYLRYRITRPDSVAL